MNKHNVKSVLVGVAMVFLSAVANSAVLDGVLEFAGTVKKTSGITTNATNFGVNNTISFVEGDFVGLINVGDTFLMTGVNLGLVPAPASSSWSIGNFNIVLNSASVLNDGSPDPLDMFGTGTITDLSNQFDVTQIEWSFSETTFTATKSIYEFKINTVSEVPVPAAGWMLFSALGSAGLIRLRRKS